jgi:hypothetical protein
MLQWIVILALTVAVVVLWRKNRSLKTAPPRVVEVPHLVEIPKIIEVEKVVEVPKIVEVEKVVEITSFLTAWTKASLKKLSFWRLRQASPPPTLGRLRFVRLWKSIRCGMILFDSPKMGECGNP